MCSSHVTLAAEIKWFLCLRFNGRAHDAISTSSPNIIFNVNVITCFVLRIVTLRPEGPNIGASTGASAALLTCVIKLFSHHFHFQLEGTNKERNIIRKRKKIRSMVAVASFTLFSFLFLSLLCPDSIGLDTIFGQRVICLVQNGKSSSSFLCGPSKCSRHRLEN